jgi:hypothetical protein
MKMDGGQVLKTARQYVTLTTSRLSLWPNQGVGSCCTTRKPTP